MQKSLTNPKEKEYRHTWKISTEQLWMIGKHVCVVSLDLDQSSAHKDVARLPPGCQYPDLGCQRPSISTQLVCPDFLNTFTSRRIIGGKNNTLKYLFSFDFAVKLQAVWGQDGEGDPKTQLSLFLGLSNSALGPNLCSHSAKALHLSRPTILCGQLAGIRVKLLTPKYFSEEELLVFVLVSILRVAT